MFTNKSRTIKKALLLILLTLPFYPQLCYSQRERLANEDKTGLYVKSLDQVLRLPDSEVDLATAALIVSEQWSDMVQGRRHLAALDEMAIEIRRRMQQRRLRANQSVIPVINEYLFGELGFKPVSQATDPNDLFLHSVLDNKRGYCLSLSVLYLAIAERLGLPIYGVVVPGHFFARYDDGRTKLNIETTNNGAGNSDSYYIEKFKVPPSRRDSIYMKNLSKVQTLGCLLNNLGNTYFDIGDLDTAMATLQTAVQINPTLAESRANLGNMYLKMGLLQTAVYEYQQSIEINPGDAKTHSNLGNAYLEKGQAKDAISQYKQAIALDVNFADAYKNLAIAYCQEKMFQPAMAQLKKAISMEPNNAGLYSQLGEIYYQMGDCEQAILQFQKALKIEQNLPDAYFGLATCYHTMKLPEDEIQAYQNALALKPNMLPALVNLGNAYYDKKDYNSAIRQYQKAAQINPDDARIHYNLGVTYANITEYQKAADEYLETVRIDPDMGDAHYGLAFAFYKLKNYESAYKYIMIAKKLGIEVTDEQIQAIKQNLK